MRGSMEAKINYALVGGFVIILTAALIIFITWLSADFTLKRYKTYLVIMNESVNGITTNSSVKYNGIEVGKVHKITFSQNNPREIRLLLKVEKNTPITAGTTATLNSQGFTGITFIALNGSDANKQPLQILPGEQYPIIPSVPSIFSRLDTTLRNLTMNMNLITQDINKVLGGENPKLFKSILDHLNVTTQHLAAQSSQLDSIILNTAKTMRSFPSLMDVLTQSTLPRTNKVLNNLTLMSDNLLEFSDHLRENPAILLRGQAATTPGPGE
jgi:phospholipid/cholesterol/gamma-HCH transport system substrate-binding protein